MITGFETAVGSSFVLLTTFHKDGRAVPTAVWIAPVEQDVATVTTYRSTGKVKRLRRTSRASIQPCSRTAQPTVGSDPVEVSAVLLEDPDWERAASQALIAKYGLQFRVVTWMERLSRKTNGRVFLRITPHPPTLSNTD